MAAIPRTTRIAARPDRTGPGWAGPQLVGLVNCLHTVAPFDASAPPISHRYPAVRMPVVGRPSYEGRPPRPSRKGGTSSGSLEGRRGPKVGAPAGASGDEAKLAGARHGLGAVRACPKGLRLTQPALAKAAFQ